MKILNKNKNVLVDTEEVPLDEAGLSGAYLVGAYLVDANLSGANLVGANLSGANLSEKICRIDFGGWSICIRKDVTSIGCQNRTNSEWLAITGNEDWITKIDGASEFWAAHREIICAAIREVQS